MISWYVKLTCTIEEFAVKYSQCNRCHEPKSKSSKTIRIRKFSEHEENTELKDTGITCLAHSWRPVLLRWFCTNTTPLKSTTKYYTISYRGSETFGKLNVKLLQHFFIWVTYFSLESEKSWSNNFTFAIVNSIHNLQLKMSIQLCPFCINKKKSYIFDSTGSFFRKWRTLFMSLSSIALPIKAWRFLWIRNIATCIKLPFN